jgi:hypothetical protein
LDYFTKGSFTRIGYFFKEQEEICCNFYYKEKKTELRNKTKRQIDFGGAPTTGSNPDTTLGTTKKTLSLKKKNRGKQGKVHH